MMTDKTEQDDDRSFLSIPIVIETLAYRFNHNRRFVGAKMVSGPPNVMTHIGEGGDNMDERSFFETIKELSEYGYSYEVKSVVEERGPLDVVGNWVMDAEFKEDEKYPEVNVWTW